MYTTVQKYTVLSAVSKAIGVISDGPALPLFFIIYGLYRNPSPLTFAAYVTFWVLFHELTIKGIFHRKRPNTAGDRKGFSFPSSHSFASGFIIVTVLFFTFPWKLALILLALINVINRPALGVHYIADAIAGMSIGIFAALWWPLILRIVTVALP